MISASQQGQTHADFNMTKLGRTGRSFDPCRFLELGEVSHVAGDGGL